MITENFYPFEAKPPKNGIYLTISSSPAPGGPNYYCQREFFMGMWVMENDDEQVLAWAVLPDINKILKSVGA